MSRIALLSNVTTGILEQELIKDHTVFIPDGFDTWKFELLNPASRLYEETFDAVFFLLYADASSDNWQVMEDAKEELTQWVDLVGSLASQLPKTPIFVSNLDIRRRKIMPLSARRFEAECEVYFSNALQTVSRDRSKVYIWDVQTLVTDLGRNYFYSDKMWYMSNNPYSIKGIKELSKDMAHMIHAVNKAPKKCLVLDLDNTVWGGIVGEDGINGIELSPYKEGARFYDMQKRILEIKEHGILLSILSKNNEEDVWEVFEKHPDIVLKKKHFICPEVNWESKAQNLRKIAKKLNIGLDSFVFVDDNPVEREEMKQLNPEVSVVDFPQDTSQLEKMVRHLYKEHFFTLDLTDEDKVKTKMYLQEDTRKEMRSQYKSLDEYLSDLCIEIRIHKMQKGEQERVVQLCNKTNQFNLTTKRYGAKEIEALEQSEDVDLFTVCVKDRLGDSGLVAVLIVKVRTEPEIDTFLMSCRVMGRGIEKAIYVELHNHYAKLNYQKIHAIYLKTEKNKPVENLYENLGFYMSEQDNFNKKYEQLLTRRKQTEIVKTIQFSAERVEDAD